MEFGRDRGAQTSLSNFLDLFSADFAAQVQPQPFRAFLEKNQVIWLKCAFAEAQDLGPVS